MIQLGDLREDATTTFLWSTNDSDGAAITRAADGEVRIYKDDGTTESTVGITDTEDFDAMTGVHCCKIDTSADAFYTTGHDYNVVLSGATIDGQTVNAVLAHFSIENRSSLLKATGITEGGTWTLEKILKIILAWNIGLARDKSGSQTIKEVLDPEDGVTVIAEVVPSKTTPYKEVTVKI